MKFKNWWRLVLLLGLALAVLFIPLPTRAAMPAERTFRIDASRFAYDPEVIQVNPGDRVTFELVATDVVHGLSIDGYNLATTADPGKPASLTFTADREGAFRFHCTVTCGNLHPFMTGELKVGRNILLWRVLLLVGLAMAAGIWIGHP